MRCVIWPGILIQLNCAIRRYKPGGIVQTEEAVKAAGIETKSRKYMFMASGKASAAGAREGFVKLVFTLPMTN